jgi:hypothetical protein
MEIELFDTIHECMENPCNFNSYFIVNPPLIMDIFLLFKYGTS